jgi:predicted metal-dependent hydrolase
MKTWKNKQEFKSEVYSIAKDMDISVKSLSLRPMRSKWASCSTNGNLNFNVQLLEFEKDIGKYVILHELLHFRVPNHGKLWKSFMLAYMRNYEKIEKKLKALAQIKAIDFK